ncbi:LysR family transcriptional regulator [Roseomonas hellenica]|uniref:LysR family transcriptional regulator n=1 Tax=Plastoroseomonas hellenica TaxID=2687306 RepID=A0ABS5EXD5_9PROT|nr:LysR substrate-binding domain-containing protein [Plastoroseomonas hellenica]MBR0664960.1 LysR family transcriptional regulator [Plastoroseomonas hellenica]
MPSPPDWVTLRILLAADALGSLSRAAEHCGIAISAAAKRIQDLEQQHGVQLLDRGAKGVRATAAGERLIRHARALFELGSRMEDDLRAFAAGGTGSVRLGATTSALSGHRLAEALAGFAQAQPGIAVTLQEETSLAILHEVLEGRVDLGIVTSAAALPTELEAHGWHGDALLAVMPAGHRLADRASLRYAALLDEPLIGVQAGGALAILLEEEARRLGRAPQYRFRVATTDSARRLAAAGLGATVMPDGVARPYLAALGLAGVPLAEDWARRRLRIVARPAPGLPAAARLLLNHLLAQPEAG